MIKLTKLNGHCILVNPDTIKYIEEIPDRLVHFLNGESLCVKESMEEIVEEFVELKQKMAGSSQVEARHVSHRALDSSVGIDDCKA